MYAMHSVTLLIFFFGTSIRLIVIQFRWLPKYTHSQTLSGRWHIQILQVFSRFNDVFHCLSFITKGSKVKGEYLLKRINIINIRMKNKSVALDINS